MTLYTTNLFLRQELQTPVLFEPNLIAIQISPDHRTPILPTTDRLTRHSVQQLEGDESDDEPPEELSLSTAKARSQEAAAAEKASKALSRSVKKSRRKSKAAAGIQF